jgi:hypothetical protein
VEITEQDDLELGERVSLWLLHEELAGVYGRLNDRIGSMVLLMFASIIERLRPLPECWQPRFDGHGMLDLA